MTKVDETMRLLEEKGFFCGKEFNYRLLVTLMPNTAMAGALGGAIGAAIAQGASGGPKWYLLNATEEGLFRIELGPKFIYTGANPEFDGWGNVALMKKARTNLWINQALKVVYMNGKKIKYIVQPKVKEYPELENQTKEFMAFVAQKFAKK